MAALRVIRNRIGAADDGAIAVSDQRDGEGVKETMNEPARALVGASGIVDLVVVGSRGPHGLKALGSVSERVAHQALSSVLVVREAPWQQAEGQGGNNE